MKNYKSCEVCNCVDCKKGTYRIGSWYCSVLKKQICDICCYYDKVDIKGQDLTLKCKSLKCKHYREEFYE
jgi:hypothetical protein